MNSSNQIESMWADDTDDFECVPMSDIRIKVWARQYPTWYDRCGNIFQSHFPSPREVGDWKRTWIKSEFRVRTELSRDAVFLQCKILGIHPYFWQYVTFDEVITHEYKMAGHYAESFHQTTMVVFFYDEDHIMYKLKYR